MSLFNRALLGSMVIGATACGHAAEQVAKNSASNSMQPNVVNIPARPDSTYATAADLEHCLFIYKDGFGFKLKGHQYNLKNEKDLQDFVALHRDEIMTKMLTLVASENPPAGYKNLVDAIDALTIARIEKYQVKDAK